MSTSYNFAVARGNPSGTRSGTRGADHEATRIRQHPPALGDPGMRATTQRPDYPEAEFTTRGADDTGDFGTNDSIISDDAMGPVNIPLSQPDYAPPEVNEPDDGWGPENDSARTELPPGSFTPSHLVNSRGIPGGRPRNALDTDNITPAPERGWAGFLQDATRGETRPPA